eukprot:5784095-Pleurochrysis_carterae.AAC.1
MRSLEITEKRTKIPAIKHFAPTIAPTPYLLCGSGEMHLNPILSFVCDTFASHTGHGKTSPEALR